MRRTPAVLGTVALALTSFGVLAPQARAAEEVKSISPDTAANTTTTAVDVTIVGADFGGLLDDPAPSVTLKLGSFTIEATDEELERTLIGDDVLHAKVVVAGQPPGRWDVIVDDGGGSTGALANAFTITAKAPVITAVCVVAGPACTTPARGIPGGDDVRIRLTGQNFAHGMNITASPSIQVTDETLTSLSTIEATVDASNGGADGYDLTLTHYGSTLRSTCVGCFALVGPKPSWLITNRFAGPADRSFALGQPTDKFLACDWDGDGADEPVIFRNGLWAFRSSATAGAFDRIVSFGTTGDTPLCGDWNGDGVDTLGIRRGSEFRLRNTNTGGSSNIVFSWGRSTDIPLPGNWNRLGGDGMALFRPGTGQWFMKNGLGATTPQQTFVFGTAAGDRPVAGDWNGDGFDTPGLRRGRSFLLRNTLSSGSIARTFNFGLAGYPVVSGNWNGDPIDTVGVVITS